jgi:hypothetical protein
MQKMEKVVSTPYLSVESHDDFPGLPPRHTALTIVLPQCRIQFPAADFQAAGNESVIKLILIRARKGHSHHLRSSIRGI